MFTFQSRSAEFNIEHKIVMTSARLVHQVLALLSFSVFIQSTECHPVSQYVRDVNLSAPETFVQSVFDEFGSNNSMNSQQFNLLLKELSIGSSSSEQASKIGNKKVKANLYTPYTYFLTYLEGFSYV